MCGEPARRTENREVTSAATTHVTSGKGSPLGREDPTTTYLAAERDVSLRPLPDCELSHCQTSPLHPPLLQPGPRRAQVAWPPRGAGAAEGSGPPRSGRSINRNYTQHLFKLHTVPSRSPNQAAPLTMQRMIKQAEIATAFPPIYFRHKRPAAGDGGESPKYRKAGAWLQQK